ncbi:PIN domain-containing protein [Halorutilales archaeon Cl-col2-1]
MGSVSDQDEDRDKDKDEDTGRQKVIFDTNALMVPSQFGVDVFDEVERLVGGYVAVVPRGVVNELKSLATSDTDAEMGLEIANERCEVVEHETEGRKTDDVIVEIAENSDEVSAVVTNDRELIDRLLDVGVRVVRLRQGSHLQIRYP